MLLPLFCSAQTSFVSNFVWINKGLILFRYFESEPKHQLASMFWSSIWSRQIQPNYSGAPAARRAAKRSPIIIEKGTTRMHRNRNLCNSFLMVKMASGMDHGRVRPTTTTRTRTTNNDVAQHGGHPANTKSCSPGLQHISLILDMHTMFNWQLSYHEIRWPVSRDHIAGSSLELVKVACFFEVDRWPSSGFSLGSRAHVSLTCWKQSWIVRKPVNANPGLYIS